MNITKGIIKSLRMAKVPVKPLVAIIGATGTGKSDVGPINPNFFQNQNVDLHIEN
jgi:predicted ATPase